MRHLVVPFLFAGLFVATAGTHAAILAPAPTVVYVVRHAEKAPAPKEDPPLSDAGAARAEALARVLQGAAITAIYSSKFQRTENTVRPLSQRLGLPISYGSAGLDDPEAYARKLATDVLKKHRGKNVLIVNHSNTVPVIVETLSGQSVQPMSDFEFATLFIVTVPSSGKPSVVRAQYGQPDGVAPAVPKPAAFRSILPTTGMRGRV